jgi:transaldolase
MGSQLKDLAAAGQSVWLDNINRSMFSSGELKKLIGDGLRGQTSNPTIFEKAIGHGSDYDEQLKTLIGGERDAQKLFEALAIDDIRAACDLFKPVFETTRGLDGYVSLEVSPTLAHDAQATTAAAARLWKAVDRPNVMIKIPGTPECLASIRASIAAGININVTLLFSVEQYTAAANAYIDGIDDRLKAGLPVDAVASVASVFVSRIDSTIDKRIDDKIAAGGPASLADLKGKAGIANLKLTYARFEELFRGERFTALKAKGAKAQRPLWASTSTKNPAYDDLMYVVTVVGTDTVNTMPPKTMEALMDHGKIVADTIHTDVASGTAAIDALEAQAGIALAAVTDQLVAEGVTSFANSFEDLLAAITGKADQLAGKQPMKVEGS